MEISQVNSLRSYVKEAKMSFFLFFLYKIGEQEEQILSGVGVGTSERREEVGKECGRANRMQILCTHVFLFLLRYTHCTRGINCDNSE
jgi:hypothetical protein